MFTIANIRPYGHNIGNQAIHFALRQMVYQAFGRLVSIIEYPATLRYQSSGAGGLTPASVFELNRFADGVIVGGGNLYENGELDIDERSLSALQPPLMLFSNSRGRIYDRFDRLAERSDVLPTPQLKALLDRADISLSRDSATHEFSKSIHGKDELGWCPTIGLDNFTGLLPTLPANETAGALISVRTPSLMNVPYRVQSRVQNHVESAIDALKASGHTRVRILCNDSRDLDFATVFRYSKGVDSVFTNDVYEYLALLKSATIVVSYRLHATLPSIAFGAPVVNIAYDERARSLIHDLGIEASSLDLVRSGDGFVDALEGRIMAGGYAGDEHASRREEWNEKFNFQLGRLEDFKRRVEDYMAGPGDASAALSRA